VKGEEEVEEKVQNIKTAVMATANAVQLNEVDIAVFNWCDLRVWTSCLEISGVPRLLVPFPCVPGRIEDRPEVGTQVVLLNYIIAGVVVIGLRRYNVVRN
jgi:hypothetical protein